MKTIRWCVEHDEHESAPDIGYCWLFAAPYTYGGTPCRIVDAALVIGS